MSRDGTVLACSVCAISFIKNLGCTGQHIYQTIYSKKQNRFISHKLKALIRNYERTARHFWTKHAQHSTEMKCAICFETIERTKRLSGRGREVQYIGCCFSKVHPACFYYFSTCYIFGTKTLPGLRDPMGKWLY